MLPLPLPLPHWLPPSLIKSGSAFYQDSQVIRMHINILEALLCWESLSLKFDWFLGILECSIIPDPRTVLNTRTATMEVLRDPF